MDIGYRYYNDHNLRPLFPFGFGLSYTSFSLSNASVSTKGTVATVGVQVANTGSRSGTALVQAYLTYPTAAGETAGSVACLCLRHPGARTIQGGHDGPTAERFRSVRGRAFRDRARDLYAQHRPVLKRPGPFAHRASALGSRSLGPTGPRTVQFEPQGEHGTDADDLGRLVEQAGRDVLSAHDGEAPVV